MVDCRGREDGDGDGDGEEKMDDGEGSSWGTLQTIRYNDISFTGGSLHA